MGAGASISRQSRGLDASRGQDGRKASVGRLARTPDGGDPRDRNVKQRMGATSGESPVARAPSAPATALAVGLRVLRRAIRAARFLSPIGKMAVGAIAYRSIAAGERQTRRIDRQVTLALATPRGRARTTTRNDSDGVPALPRGQRLIRRFHVRERIAHNSRPEGRSIGRTR
jgi:hypothetical protein